MTTDSPRDTNAANGYAVSFLTAYALEKAGAALTRENILDIATHLDKIAVPLLLPGITVSTTPTANSGISQFQIQRFQGGRWIRAGDTISGD